MGAKNHEYEVRSVSSAIRVPSAFDASSGADGECRLPGALGALCTQRTGEHVNASGLADLPYVHCSSLPSSTRLGLEDAPHLPRPVFRSAPSLTSLQSTSSKVNVSRRALNQAWAPRDCAGGRRVSQVGPALSFLSRRGLAAPPSTALNHRSSSFRKVWGRRKWVFCTPE